MAPSKHLWYPQSTRRCQHRCSSLRSSPPPQEKCRWTAPASLLGIWIMHVFTKKFAMQVTSTDCSAAKIWAKPTADIGGEKMGLGFCLLCLYGLSMRTYHILCNPPIWLLSEAFSFFLASRMSTGNAAWKQRYCADSVCHLLFSSWITAGCWLCRN